MENFKFGSKIVGYEVHKPQDMIAEPTQAPLKTRDEILDGKTYKATIPDKSSLYITINDADNGTPFEIFINSRDNEHKQWQDALTRVMSAVFRREDDVAFLAKELKEVVDPNGGYWKKGKYIPSIVHDIGSTLEQHLTNKKAVSEQKNLPVIAKPTTIQVRGQDVKLVKGHKCPSCGEYGIQKVEGCEKCVYCDYSKCG